MFLLPTWMPNLKPSTEMTSSSPSSETVTMTTSASSSSSSPPLSHSESAFAAYKTMNDTTAAATTSFLSLHPPPPPTLQSSILEHTASMQRSLWQKLLPTDAISAAAAAAVAAAVGTHHPGPSHATWNQELLSSHHYANSGGAFADLPMDGGFPRSKNGARESTGTLKAWLCRNLKNPYPSKGEKIMLAIITRMTLTQVSTWFANARRRLKKERTFRWRVDDDDDDDYSDEYNNDDDDKDDDGRDENELQLLDDDDDESMVMNRTRSLKKKRPESPDFCCASKRRRCEERSLSKRKRRSGQTEEAKAEDVGTLRSLTLTWTESRAEGDDNKPPSSPLCSLSCSSCSSRSSSSSPPASVPSLTSTRCLSSDQQVAVDETKRSDVAPSGSTCFIQAQTSIDAAAVDLRITSKTNTAASSSSSSSSSSVTSSASTSNTKPRIWSIVEIATT